MDSTTPHFTLPERSGLGLRDQICEMVSSAISSQSLSPDKRLPSCRELAEQLGVSRNTVFSAYNQLIDLGLLIARDRSGYFVSPAALISVDKPDQKNRNVNRVDTPVPVTFDSLGLAPVDNPMDWTNYPYPFIYNQIDPDLFPADSWRKCTRLALSQAKVFTWRDDAVESDSPELSQQLRQRLLNSRGIYAHENEVLITLGAQNALFIIGAIFACNKKPIAMENPGFPYGRNAFQLTGNQLCGVPVDGEGIMVSAIPDCKLVFTTPSHQFPTMVTMSQHRRVELLDAAIRNDFLIIEDDYESEMNYFNTRSKSLRSQDNSNRVIYIGSLSKIISPGIRLGFIIAHPEIIKQARVVRGAMMRHPPTIIQEIVALFFQLGHYDSHLRNIERRYKKRWHVMNDAITKHLTMLDKTPTKGGTSFWLTGPEGFNSTELERRLRTRGVLIDIGEKFWLDKNQRSFRLGFAFVSLEKLEKGIQIIAEEVNYLLKNPKGDSQFGG